MNHDISFVCVLNHIEMIPLLIHNYQSIITSGKKELIIIDDSDNSSLQSFLNLDDCIYLHLQQNDKDKFMKTIFDNFKEPNKNYLYYQKIINQLPSGFKRDYACGFCSYPYIFHMNDDCIYHPKTIERKLRFLKKTSSECIFSDKTLCYDIYGKELYKTESPVKIYESTLFHTQEFWKRRGFIWSDVKNEGKLFHSNNGIDRIMDNYYDTIQLLSIQNMNLYSPVKITLDNIDIIIPPCINEIKITEHPMKSLIHDLLSPESNILGINSEFLENIELYYSIDKIIGKWKQPKLAGLIQNFNKNFHCLIYGSKYPAWSIFDKISFDIILLESHKNREQMDSIIQNCKTFKYIEINGIYINESFLSTISKQYELSPELSI